ncbi:putative protein HRI1 [Lyophyllum shimeji]|uniref:Protein HRI1 n=1 Tax=Lyophyllum shimeji TaxID=47721 RepID=A0A9P3PYX3_LYOSH|nr:putative protein HRI1 [Lyophyllum shimeji]
MSVAAYRSFRLSMRWLLEEASEPTSTIVLTGAKTGVFLDTRFIKGSSDLDWAFAGYRSTDPGALLMLYSSLDNIHEIDSRTMDPAEDSGRNTTLPDGTTLEEGEMVNPDTGKMTPFEEIWRDEEETDGRTVLFMKNILGTTWQARVGNWEIALGREKNGVFWAWQSAKLGGEWTVKYATTSVGYEHIAHLPDNPDWEEGSSVEWAGDKWVVLERGGR